MQSNRGTAPPKLRPAGEHHNVGVKPNALVLALNASSAAEADTATTKRCVGVGLACGVRSAQDRAAVPSPGKRAVPRPSGKARLPLPGVDVRHPLMLSERAACLPLGRRTGRKL